MSAGARINHLRGNCGGLGGCSSKVNTTAGRERITDLGRIFNMKRFNIAGRGGGSQPGNLHGGGVGGGIIALGDQI